MLLNEEEWAKKEKDEGKLLYTREEWIRKSNKGGGTHLSLGQQSRSSSEYRGRDYGRGVRDKSKVRCFKCSAYGHYAAECKKPRRDKDQKEEVNMVQMQDDEPALLLAESKEHGDKAMMVSEEKVVPKLSKIDESKQVESNMWYLDNGASNHMTGQKCKFVELDEGITGQVKFGDGSIVHIKGKGSIMLRCKNGEERILREVYYIPSLCNNIISLGQLSEEGNKVILSGEHLWVYDKERVLLMKVKRSMNRLYKIIIDSRESSCFLSKCDESSWLWHSRLGHVNFKAMTMMSSNQMVQGLPTIKQPSEVCPGCLMSKQTRRLFPSQANYSSKEVLELVHGDLCGPITPATPAGNKYFFLLVDDYSRVMWVYLLKNKDDALEAFKKFRAQVENSPERKIKTLRTDRGGEFCSKSFTSYCEGAGITRHFTAPYSPQQNGVVERRN